MTEMWTQKQISEWQITTFGPPKSALTGVIRANSEMAELLAALSKDPESKDAIAEAADVVIVLSGVAEPLGIDMAAFDTRTVFGTRVPNANINVAINIHLSLCNILAPIDFDESNWLTKHTLQRTYYFLKILVSRLGSDLQTEIDKKMEINVARKWKVAADGTAQHIENKFNNLPNFTSVTGPLPLPPAPDWMTDPDVVAYMRANRERIERMLSSIRESRFADKSIVTTEQDTARHIRENSCATVDFLDDLSPLRGMKMTSEQAEEQRRSFAYGNCAIDNPNVTREMVDKIADEIGDTI